MNSIRLFICWIALAIPVFSQSNAIDAAIEGYLRDASGGAIQGGRVTVRNSATNVATQTATNPDGYFRFPLLQVGAYELKAEADGFKAATQPNLRQRPSRSSPLAQRYAARRDRGPPFP